MATLAPLAPMAIESQGASTLISIIDVFFTISRRKRERVQKEIVVLVVSAKLRVVDD